jgi:acetylglutamate kinase
MDNLFVIKIGGNIIDNEAKLASFLETFAKIDQNKILVHGGGKLATKLAEQLHLPQQMIEGRRITDAETLKIVTMVYAGYINKNIVAGLQLHQCNAIGFCGADGNLVQAHKREHPSIDYGFAGDVDAINYNLLKNLLENNFTPVVAPITHDRKGQLLNTNADTIAQEIAKAMAVHFDVQLIYSFEKSGVLMDAENDATVIGQIDLVSYQSLKDRGIIFSGMIPKLDNAFAALKKGVKKVIIGKAEELEQLIRNEKGTTISNE